MFYFKQAEFKEMGDVKAKTFSKTIKKKGQGQSYRLNNLKIQMSQMNEFFA